MNETIDTKIVIDLISSTALLFGLLGTLLGIYISKGKR